MKAYLMAPVLLLALGVRAEAQAPPAIDASELRILSAIG